MIDDQAELKRIVLYKHDEGSFVRIKQTSSRSPVGASPCFKRNGYFVIRFKGRKYMAHILAWLYHYGEWPSGEIDHINHNRLDNRISNLRVVSRAENGRNQSICSRNKSGVCGVYMNKSMGKWHAQIRVDGKAIHIGYFDDINDAAAARKKAEEKYGFHENHGNMADKE